MGDLLRQAWGTPLPQLTLIDCGVAVATLLLLSLIVEAIGSVFGRPEAASDAGTD